MQSHRDIEKLITLPSYDQTLKFLQLFAWEDPHFHRRALIVNEKPHYHYSLYETRENKARLNHLVDMKNTKGQPVKLVQTLLRFPVVIGSRDSLSLNKAISTKIENQFSTNNVISNLIKFKKQKMRCVLWANAFLHISWPIAFIVSQSDYVVGAITIIQVFIECLIFSAYRVNRMMLLNLLLLSAPAILAQSFYVLLT
jgi:hypothetical protein